MHFTIEQVFTIDGWYFLSLFDESIVIFDQVNVMVIAYHCC